MADRLTWLVFGAGAVGTYVGASLLMNGHKVVFIDQPESATEIIERGLKLNIHGQEHRILHPVVYTTLPGAISHSTYDIAIFTLKSFDTAYAIEMMRPFVDRIPPVLCLQNGVENESLLESLLGKDKVIAGTLTSAVQRRAAGDIQLERKRGIGISASHLLSPRIARALSDSSLNAHLYNSAIAMKWSKMLTNLLANASSAILDLAPATIFRNPGLYRVEIAQLRETLAVMHAMKIQVVDLPGIPVRAFSWFVEKLSPRLSRPILSRLAGRGRGAKMPSFHMDLHSGRGNSEVEYLNGAVIRFGKRLAIPTPVNSWLNQTLLQLTHGLLPVDEYSHQPSKYLDALAASTAIYSQGQEAIP